MTAETPTASPDATVDAFFGGRFHLVQPRLRGHRSGMDALVLAAAAPSDFSGAAADFGAGAGAVGLAVASRCPQATVMLVERSAEMAGYAQRSLAHPANTALATRISVLSADVTLSGAARRAAGLADRSTDFVLMNPPFNDARDRATPAALRRDAHVMDQDTFEAWLRTAAAILRPGGGVALIARPNSLPDIFVALDRRYGGVALVPVLPYDDAAAIRVVLRATLGSRAGLSLLPPLVLHEGTERRFKPRALAINAGTASLFGD